MPLLISGEILQGALGIYALPEFGMIRGGDVRTDPRAHKRFGSAHEILHETKPLAGRDAWKTIRDRRWAYAPEETFRNICRKQCGVERTISPSRIP